VTHGDCASILERELLEMLPLSEQCSADEAELVRFCYENILNKVGQVRTTPHAPPQPFYDPFSGTTLVSRCQKRTPGLYGARED